MFLQKALIFTLSALMLIGPAQSAERTTYLVSDAAGSPVAAMNEQGDVVWRKSYMPYGEEATPPAGNPNPSYTGKPLDAETGLVYMGARLYDPETARFTGIDPRGFDENNVQSFGRYIYANNSPYVYNDPNGEVALPIILGVGAFLLFTSPNANAPTDYNTPTPALGPDGLGVGVAAGIGAYIAAEAGFAAATRLKAPKRSAPDDAQISKETIHRKSPGRDGAESTQTIERRNGETISRTHQVKKNGEIVHQHQNHVGKYGGERQFPDEWTGTKTINAPYENRAPSFGPRE